MILKYSVLAFLLTFGIISKFLPTIAKYIKQSIRSDVLTHHIAKEGTPTMGGVIIVLVSTITSLLVIDFDYKGYAILLVMLGFSIIGAVDDCLKLYRGKGRGLTARQKSCSMLAVAAIFCVYLAHFDANFYIWRMPFSNASLDLVYFAPIMTCLALIGTANAVNLTDGLDGLVLVPLILALFAVIWLNFDYSITNFAMILASCCLAMLYFNIHPARLFLGDVGSLGLGGALAAIFLVMHKAFLLIPLCLLFVVEAGSVIIQVISFRCFGRRVFKMTPLHHHFEILGWHERKIVIVFWLFALLAVVITTLLEIFL